jgi:hypothetical protein
MKNFDLLVLISTLYRQIHSFVHPYNPSISVIISLYILNKLVFINIVKRVK